VAPTTTEATIQPATVERTELTRDDAQANRAAGALAMTGGNPVPLVILGIVLLLGGATLAMVARQRERRSAA
jgi:hypothetical protein